MSISPRHLTTTLVVVLVASCLPRALTSAGGRPVDLARYGREDARSARTRSFGPAYVDAIERIRAALPKGAEYLLANGSPRPSAVYDVRWDLAPRRCRYLGSARRARTALALADGERSIPWLVLIGPDDVPALVATAEFSGLPRGPEDSGIPCALDVPAENEVVSGELAVQGWCQESGGRPCPRVHVLADGFERPARTFVRIPRSDVEKAVPGIGSCERAGYLAVFPFGADSAGEHEVVVVLETADGRIRRLGPRVFTWRAR